MRRVSALAAGISLAGLGYAAWAISLPAPYFLTGWCAGGLLALVAHSWWITEMEGPRLRRRLRLHVYAAILLLALFAIHVDFRVPNGWLEVALTALFAAMLASTAVGAKLVGAFAGVSHVGRAEASAPRHEAGERQLRRWLFVHVPLTYSLLSLSLFHGLFVHSHGALAHLFL